MNKKAVLYALCSAGLFGVSTPAAKALLGVINPIVLAGLLYCGAGLGVAIVRRIAPRALAPEKAPQVPLARHDALWLSGAVAAGGIVGPILLMVGLARTEASTASLLLTLEGAATALMAWFLFNENFDRRIAFGMLCIVTGAAVLAWSGTPTISNLIGPVCIAGACTAWALDNNLTRKVSLADPLQIVEIKGLVAGPVSLTLGLLAGESLPGPLRALEAGVLGFIGYGVSLTLFVIALRHLGTARTGAYFSTAPFIGAMAAIIGLGEQLTWQLGLAGTLMGLGVWLHLTEHHQHLHTHEFMKHSHPHEHDEHHRHTHGTNDPPGEPHTHVHEHDPMTHEHPHMPDMHHAHRH
jgi:drug/metabolite transporter (DMT)-like permease